MTDNSSPGSVPVPSVPAVSPLCLALLPGDAAAALDAVIALHTAQSRSLVPLPDGTLEGTASLAARYATALLAARAEVELFAGIHQGYGARSEARQRCERRNAAQIVDALLAAGYELNLNNGGEGQESEDCAGLELESWTRSRAVILAAMFATDDETLCARWPGTLRRQGVFFVYGNADDGSEVVSDYHVSLSPVIDPVIDAFPGNQTFDAQD